MSNDATSTIEKPDTRTRKQPPYHVIILNDDDHTVEYVVTLCSSIFGHSVEKGIEIAKEIHLQGKAIVFTGSLEVAELKQEQIHSFGPDPLIAKCKGSMTAIIEKA
jgi:ATP-dependent Clp protease adaptor protein ClpS